MAPTPSQERTDEEELKEIIKELLYQLDFAYHKRVQKLLFYGEVWCIQNFGRRLTDASFKSYDYGAFSDDIDEALNDLVQEGEVEYEEKVRHGRSCREYKGRDEGGKISQAKKEILSQILDDIGRRGTGELAQFSEQSWLYQNTEYGEEMDFEYYAENVVFHEEDLKGLSNPEEDPVGADDVEDLITG